MFHNRFQIWEFVNFKYLSLLCLASCLLTTIIGAASTNNTENPAYSSVWVLESGGVDTEAVNFSKGGLKTYSGLPASQVKKLTASDGAAHDCFGVSISISDDYAVVGAIYDDDNDTDSGSAYIFCKDQGGDGNWGQVKKLLALDGAYTDWFGYSVAIYDDYAIVGALYDDDNGNDSGSAYIFYKDQDGASNWGQAAKLTPSDGATSDCFGISVSIYGDYAIVGAFYDDDNSTNSGSAYIFYKDNGGLGNWGQVTKLVAADGAAGDLFGHSVAISGDYAVVGAYGDDDNGSESGSAYIFYKDEGGVGNWGQSAKLTASDGARVDKFGRSVSISGDYVVVGARYDDDNGSDSGSAYIFYKDQGGTGNWGQVAKLTADDGTAGDLFGQSVSISGDYAIVGAYYDDDFGTDSGSAYIFYKDQGGVGAWGQAAKLTAADGAQDDWFGHSVSISGDYALCGAYGDEDYGSNSGSAYIFSDILRNGSLQVFLEPAEARAAGARWRRTETVEWRESGDWEHDIPAGEYYVEFKPTDSWLPPPKQMVTILPNQVTIITAHYSDNPGHVCFRLHPKPGVRTNGGWRLNGGDWLANGQKIALAPGLYTFEFKPVPGWYCPPIDVQVYQGKNMNLDAYYLPFLVTDCSDYNGDGASDFSHFRPSDITWRVSDILEREFGTEDAWPVPGDYNGDGQADIAYWSPGMGLWNVYYGPLFNDFGELGDLPVPGDYNGDGRTDAALYRPSSGQWLISPSSASGIVSKRTISAQILGGDPHDLPVPGDYDGDGIAEPAVYNLKNRTWTIQGMEPVKYGRIGELPVAADYNGDGKTDIAVVDLDAGLWRVRGQFEIAINSKAGEIPVPGDYNGDGAAEPALYRYKNGKWYLESGKIKFGTKEDIPLVRGR